MIKAKKRYGQNFLKDRQVLDKIIESMPNDDIQIIEIGPGLGDLTQKMLAKKAVIAYEIDDDLCKVLSVKFNKEIRNGGLTLHCEDVVKVRENGEFFNSAYHMVANLPYYIATNIILEALKDINCKSITVMVQLEVALKFCAKSKDKNFSSLSVLADSCGKAELLFKVPPEAFDPIPKVTSAVFSIKKRDNCLFSDSLSQFLKVAFKQPRKTLIKNLSLKYEKTEILEAFKELNLPLQIRPHELNRSDYEHLIINL